MSTLDLSGLNCPLPVLKTKKYLASLMTGDTVNVLTTDPASVVDLQEFCKKTGHVLIEQITTDKIIKTTIKHK